MASYLASLPATQQHTFGLKRTESLAALFSMTSLALVSIWLAYEAIIRIFKTPDASVDGGLMTVIAGIGVFVNVVLAFVLGEHHVHLPGGGGHDHSHDHCSGHSHATEHDHHQHPTTNNKSNNGSSAATENGLGHSHTHAHNNSEENQQHAHDENQHASSSCSGHDHAHSHSHHVSPPDIETASENNSETDSLLKNNHHGHQHGHHGSMESLHADEVLPDQTKRDEEQRNINLHAAYLHVLGDLAQSAAVFIAGVVIYFRPDWHIVDPICTLFFCTLVFIMTLKVLRHSIAVLLEEVPPGLNWNEIYTALSRTEGITKVHDLHIWSISHGEPCMSVHCQSSDPNALKKLTKVAQKFGIRHSTIQIQSADGPCITCEVSGCMHAHESFSECV